MLPDRSHLTNLYQQVRTHGFPVPLHKLPHYHRQHGPSALAGSARLLISSTIAHSVRIAVFVPSVWFVFFLSCHQHLPTMAMRKQANGSRRPMQMLAAEMLASGVAQEFRVSHRWCYCCCPCCRCCYLLGRILNYPASILPCEFKFQSGAFTNFRQFRP